MKYIEQNSNIEIMTKEKLEDAKIADMGGMVMK